MFNSSKKADENVILVASVKANDKAKAITDTKVEAAMDIIAGLSRKYSIVPAKVRDSIVGKLKSEGIEPTAERVARELNAGRILFFNISRLENILRVDVSEAMTGQPSKTSDGTGYAALRYRHMADEEIVYDPPLLEAMQRAFALAEKDSFMFAYVDKEFRVLPAETMVIGGLDFQDDQYIEPKWEIFDKKEVNSYDASETIFSAARDNPKYVVFDIATRDSAYALFNMHMVENYRPPTNYEINALNKLEIKYYITGIIKRTADGANITLHLCRIGENNLNIVNSVSGTITEDKVAGLRKVLMELTAKLLNG
jgi:hypothetical protein